METLLLDFRYAVRVLRKSPAFTSVALLTLMLGIGANVVVFGVLHAVLFKSLGVRDEGSLYQLRHQQWAMGKLVTTSYPTFEDYCHRNSTFSGMIAINAYSHAELRWPDGVRDVSGDEVTGNYFDLLGLQPQAGRFFHRAEEHGPNSAPYVVLSDGLWRSSFGAHPEVVGTVVQLNGHPFTVVGVASAQFHGMERFAWPDYWIPMVNEEQVEGSDYLHDRARVAVTVIGRIKAGVTPRQATENLDAVAAELAREYPATDDGQPLRLVHPGLLGDEGEVISGFLYGVTLLGVLVWVAACTNLASLFASRVADRSRELAVRMALGSTRQRLARQLLTEAAVISLFGGLAGLITAKLLLGTLNRWPRAAEAHLAANVNTSVFLEGLALTIGSAVLFGMIPAWRAGWSDPLQAIKGGTGNGPHLRRFAFRDVLLGVQIAICTLLVTVSFVAGRSLEHTLNVPLGFEPTGAMLAEIDLSQFDSGPTLSRKQAILHAIRNIPGVTGASTVSRTPFTGGMHGTPVFRPGTTEFKLQNSVLASYTFVISPGYMEAACTRLLVGRELSWHDTASSPHVAVVNQTFASKMWHKTPPIGQHFIVSGHLTEVVGIAQDGKYHDLQESPQPVIYLPLSQYEDRDTIFVVRSRRTPSEMAAALAHALSALAPNVPIAVENWSDTVSDQLFPARAATVSLGVLGLLATMLATTGIFGMAAYAVSKRMRELGIRMALGARRKQVMSAALMRPVILLAAGSAAGLLSGVLANRLLSRIVYQPNGHDPLVLAGVVLTMALIGVTATAMPARRALNADPSKLMREE